MAETNATERREAVDVILVYPKVRARNYNKDRSKTLLIGS